MGLRAWMYWLHKWSAAGAVLLTLTWFASGIVLLFPSSWFIVPVRAGIGEGNSPGYREIKVSIPEAIALMEAELGQPLEIRAVALQKVAGRLVYQLQIPSRESHLVDAVTGERFVMDEETARRILERIAPGIPVRESSSVRALDVDYFNGPLPAYRFSMQDAALTNYYIAANTGEARATNRRTRWLRFLGGTHTLRFLSPLLGATAVKGVLLLFSGVGTLMTLFGTVILWLQFRSWLEGRRSRSHA